MSRRGVESPASIPSRPRSPPPPRQQSAYPSSSSSSHRDRDDSRSREHWSTSKYTSDSYGRAYSRPYAYHDPYHGSSSSWERGGYRGRGRGRGRGTGYYSSMSSNYGSSSSHRDYAGSRRDDSFSRHGSTSRAPTESGSHRHSSSSSKYPDDRDARRRSGHHHASKDSAEDGHAHDRDGDETSGIDWADVESKARANGFIVPGDLVEEFKRQGHFDLLRRQLLSAFQSSQTAKARTQTSISDLLAAYFEANPQEAAKIAQMGDVRLQHSECMRILDMPRPRLARVNSEQSDSTVPHSGPELMRRLIEQLHTPQSDGDTASSPSQDDAFQAILSSEGKLGKAIAEQLDQLLRDELKEGERRVASPTPPPQTSATQEEKRKEAAGQRQDRAEHQGEHNPTSQSCDEPAAPADGHSAAVTPAS